MTTTPDFRALCAELVKLLQNCPVTADTDWIAERMTLLYSARTALKATPPPEPPADGEVAELVRWMRLESEDWRQANPRGYQGARLTRAAELLERTATPPPEPPTDEELLALKEKLWDGYKTIPYQGEEFMYGDAFGWALSDYRAALEKWGN